MSMDYSWSRPQQRIKRLNNGGVKNIPEMKELPEFMEDPVAPLHGYSWDIYIQVKRNPQERSEEKKWDVDNSKKKKVFHEIKKIIPNAYSIEVYNKPCRDDDISWINPEWKEE